MSFWTFDGTLPGNKKEPGSNDDSKLATAGQIEFLLLLIFDDRVAQFFGFSN